MTRQPTKDPLSTKRASKKARKRVGRTSPRQDWKKAASELEESVARLKHDLDVMTIENGRLKGELDDLAASGLDGRHKVKLNNLTHFHSRLVNTQMKCPEDQAKLAEALESVSYAMKDINS